MKDPYVEMALSHSDRTNNIAKQFEELAEAFKQQSFLNSNFDYEVRQDGSGYVYTVKYLNQYESIWDPVIHEGRSVKDRTEYLLTMLIVRCARNAVTRLANKLEQQK